MLSEFSVSKLFATSLKDTLGLFSNKGTSKRLSTFSTLSNEEIFLTISFIKIIEGFERSS